MNSNLIILPGNNLVNKEWVEKARDFFASHFKSVSVQYYDHWQNGNEIIDIAVECKKLAGTFQSLKGNVTIFAKSAGTILTMYAIHTKVLNSSLIKRCVFVGLPPTWAREHDFDIDGWSTDYTVPTILLQNDHDPAASASDIQEEQAKGNFTFLELIEQKGEDHVYDDFELIKKYLI